MSWNIYRLLQKEEVIASWQKRNTEILKSITSFSIKHRLKFFIGTIITGHLCTQMEKKKKRKVDLSPEFFFQWSGFTNT